MIILDNDNDIKNTKIPVIKKKVIEWRKTNLSNKLKALFNNSKKDLMITIENPMINGEKSN